MAEDEVIKDHATDYNHGIVHRGMWMIFKLSSSRSKLVKISGLGKIRLGKFGSFDESVIIGKPLDLTYEIVRDGVLRPVLNGEILDDDRSGPGGDRLEGYENLKGEFASKHESSDQPAVESDADSSRSDGLNGKNSQSLSYERIMQLKDEVTSGKITNHDLIRMLIKNNSTFDKKSTFAKQKYLHKKIKKHTYYFTILRPTSSALCSHFFWKDRDRIKHLTPNALFQIINQGNVHANGKYIVVDETNGVLVASVYERIQGDGLIFVISEKDKYQPLLLSYLNERQEKIRNCISYLPWFRLTPDHDDTVVDLFDPHYSDKADKYLDTIKKNRDTLEEGGFDSLLVITKHDPIRVLESLVPKLAGSARIVFYSSYKETLIELYSHMRVSCDYVNIRMYEVCCKDYQIPNEAGGFHSCMKAPGVDNYILSATRVLDIEDDLRHFLVVPQYYPTDTRDSS